MANTEHPEATPSFGLIMTLPPLYFGLVAL